MAVKRSTSFQFHDVAKGAPGLKAAEISVTRKRQVFRLGANRYFSPAVDFDEVGDIDITTPDPENVYFIVDYLIGKGAKAAGAAAKQVAADLADWLIGGDDEDEDKDEDEDGGKGSGGGVICTTTTVMSRNGATTVTTCVYP